MKLCIAHALSGRDTPPTLWGKVHPRQSAALGHDDVCKELHALTCQ